MNSNDIFSVVLNHKNLNEKFRDITSKNLIEKLPTTTDLIAIAGEFYKTNLSRMNYDYAWRIAVSYLNR